MSDEFPETDGPANTPLPGTDTAGYGSRDSDATDDLDLVFDLLRSPRRRYLLYFLYEMDRDRTTYDAAARAVADYEAAGSDAGGHPSLETIRQELHHVQLPRLEAADVVECDPRQECVRFYGNDELGAWLRLAREAELD